MKKHLSLVCLAPLMWSCASGPTRPAVDASAYLFELEVSVDPQLTEFDPDVAKGSGAGLLRGAGMGAGGCIMFGLEADATSGGSTFMLGTVLGIVISPACALVGGIVGSGTAETVEDIDARIAVLNDAARELDYPATLGVEIATRVNANPIYHIHQSPNEIARLAAIETAEPAEAGPALSPSEPVHVDHSSDPMAEPSSDAAVLEDSELATTTPPLPTEPNGLIRIHVGQYGLTGGGIDPKMPLQLTASLCVTDYATGEALVSQGLMAASTARRLEDWADQGLSGLERETLSLVGRLVDSAQAAMGRQVKLDATASCSKSPWQYILSR